MAALQIRRLGSDGGGGGGECDDAEAILPPSYELRRPDVEALLGGGNIDEDVFRDLVLRFILVPLASRYSRRDLLAG